MMPINIQTPDGGTARFPDGTPDDVITSVLAKEFGGPSSPAPKPAAEPKMGLFLSQNEKGEIGPGSIPQALMRAGQRGYTPMGQQPVSSETQMPDIQGIKDTIEGPGALAMPDVHPIGGLGIFGRPSVGTIGAELAAEKFPAAANSPSRVATAPAPVAAPSARNDLIAAGERQDTRVPSFMASESVVPKMLAGGTSGTPFVGSPVVDATQGMARDMGNRTSTLSRQISPVGADAEAAGSRAKTGIADWIDTGSKVDVKAGYDALDTLIKPDEKINPQNLRRAAAELKARDIESGTRDGQKAIDLVEEALNKPKGLTFAGLKGLRTSIGDRLNGDIVDPGISQKNLNFLFGAASEDMRFGVGRVAKGNKSDALGAFDRANTLARDTFAKRQQLGDIVGAKGDATGAEVFGRVLSLASSGAREDTQKLLLAQQTMGRAGWDDVRAGAIARMGLDRDGNFSPARFLTDYGDKKISENGRNILFGQDLKPHLDDIRTLAQAWEGGARYGNPSGSGRAVAVIAGLTALFASPAHLIAEAFAGNTIARMLAKPATAKATATYMKAYTNATQTPSQASTQMVAQAARALVAAAGEGDPANLMPKQKTTPRVTHIEQAFRLPQGTRFIDPHGDTRMR